MSLEFEFLFKCVFLAQFTQTILPTTTATSLLDIASTTASVNVQGVSVSWKKKKKCKYFWMKIRVWRIEWFYLLNVGSVFSETRQYKEEKRTWRKVRFVSRAYEMKMLAVSAWNWFSVVAPLLLIGSLNDYSLLSNWITQIVVLVKCHYMCFQLYVYNHRSSMVRYIRLESVLFYNPRLNSELKR